MVGRNSRIELLAEELRSLQEKDPTLAKVQDAAEGRHVQQVLDSSKRMIYYTYRRWTRPKHGRKTVMEQLGVLEDYAVDGT